MRVRTLKQLAGLINGLDNGFRATVTPSRSSTDSKIAGTRFRRIGKGRTGLRLMVFSPDNEVVLDHDTSETYRTVEEAIVKSVALFGDTKLNIDADEILQVGEEVRVDGHRRHGEVKIVHRRSKSRIRAYTVQFEASNIIIKFPSRMVHKV